MPWIIAVLLLVAIVEFLSCYFSVGPVQRIFSMFSILVIGVDSLVIVGIRPSLGGVIIIYFSVFRIINLIKLIDARKQIDFLRSSFLRSSLSLVICQAIVIAVSYLLNITKLNYEDKWLILCLVILAGLLIMVFSLRRSLSKTRPKINNLFKPEDKLPSLSVAIPARNETDDLEQCLDSLIRSDYPKLEILVLDDCSQEKRTPEIIRQYAHDGVRFLAGKPPPDSWTAKNYAYEQMCEEANGEVILFCGVDVRFDRQTLKKMVELKNLKRKSMISFMPLNRTDQPRFSNLLIQPLRYLWELALPRRSFRRPPVLSTCWLIDRDVLISNGTFKAVSRSIIPERYFARQSSRQKDGYSFVCLGLELGLTSVKSFDEQLSTSLRTRYPLLKQRLENVALLSLIEFTLYIAPIAVFIYGLVDERWLLAVISFVSMVLAALLLFVISRQTYNRNILTSLIFYPLVFTYDLSLGLYSMWLYEFDEVIWKGRNVCIPVMKVIPQQNS